MPPHAQPWTEERIMERVTRSADGCWLWTGHKTEHGYGVIRVGGRAGRNYLVHRFLDEIRNGAIPTGICILHSCDTPACVRPDHLFRGTQLENVRDMDAKGRCVRVGERKRGLTSAQVAEVLASDERQFVLARRYGVSKNTIRRIRQNGGYVGVTWPFGRGRQG